MGKSVVVISFDETKTFEDILNPIADKFGDDPSVLVYGAINDIADKILNVLEV